MTTMNVSLPKELKSWVEKQTRSGRYGNSSDLVRDLIRREQERLDAIDRMRALIDAGVASGVSDRTLDEIFEDALQSSAEHRRD